MTDARATAAAQVTLPAARRALDSLTALRSQMPDVADYRIEGAHKALTTTVDLLTRLESGHDPEHDAARATFRRFLATG